MEKYERVYVAMFLHVDTDGKVKPLVLEWTDGTRFTIDRVLQEKISPPTYTGGVFTKKYSVSIGGKEKTVYLDMRANRWFVERPLA